MGTVTIRIAEMQGLVEALQRALYEAPVAAKSLLKWLKTHDLDYHWLPTWREHGHAYEQLREALGDCRRRLGMAQMISAMEPRLGKTILTAVQFDEDAADKYPEDFVFHDPDPEVIKTLIEKFKAAKPKSSDSKIEEWAWRIALLVANAPEPFKSLFLKVLPDLRFAIPTIDQSWTMPVTRTVHVDLDAMLHDVPSPFHTFFHEIGHVIDHDGHGFAWESSSYKFPDQSGKNQSMDWWLEHDLRQSLSDALVRNRWTSDPDQRQRVIDAIANKGTWFLVGWEYDQDGQIAGARPGTDADVFTHLARFYNQSLGSSQNRTASDIVGGLTSDALIGRWSHPSVYWGAPVMATPTGELWAGWFADNMTNSFQGADIALGGRLPGGLKPGDIGKPPITSRDATQKAFPGATEALDDFAEKQARSG